MTGATYGWESCNELWGSVGEARRLRMVWDVRLGGASRGWSEQSHVASVLRRTKKGPCSHQLVTQMQALRDDGQRLSLCGGGGAIFSKAAQ